MSTIRVALDFNCSPKLAAAMNELYGSRGFQFLHLQSLVAGRTEDEIWADAYKRFGGKVVISGDARIAYRPHQAVAFIDNGFLSFFPDECWCHMPANAKNATFVHAWPHIENKLNETTSGGCWRIPCSYNKNDGELRLTRSELCALQIPEAELAKARHQRRSGSTD